MSHQPPDPPTTSVPHPALRRAINNLTETAEASGYRILSITISQLPPPHPPPTISIIPPMPTAAAAHSTSPPRPPPHPSPPPLPTTSPQPPKRIRLSSPSPSKTTAFWGTVLEQRPGTPTGMMPSHLPLPLSSNSPPPPSLQRASTLPVLRLRSPLPSRRSPFPSSSIDRPLLRKTGHFFGRLSPFASHQQQHIPISSSTPTTTSTTTTPHPSLLPHHPTPSPLPSIHPHQQLTHPIIPSHPPPAPIAQHPHPQQPPSTAKRLRKTPVTPDREQYFECDQCNAKFRRKSDKNRHVRVVHEKSRPFVCPMCEKTFGEKASVHDDVRTFRCPYCDNTFSQRGLCDTHVRTVHDKKQAKYFCEHCGLPFSRKVQLNDHYEQMHPQFMSAYGQCYASATATPIATTTSIASAASAAPTTSLTERGGTFTDLEISSASIAGPAPIAGPQIQPSEQGFATSQGIGSSLFTHQVATQIPGTASTSTHVALQQELHQLPPPPPPPPPALSLPLLTSAPTPISLSVTAPARAPAPAPEHGQAPAPPSSSPRPSTHPQWVQYQTGQSSVSAPQFSTQLPSSSGTPSTTTFQGHAPYRDDGR